MNEIVSQVLRTVSQQFPEVLPHLSPETLAAVKAGGGYPGIRSDYWHAVYDAVYDYLTGNKPVTSFANSVKRAFTDAYIAAAEIGYQEGGADLPFDDETVAWLTGVQSQEFGYIEELFSRLKEEWEGLDPDAEAASRAEGYVNNLDSIFSEATLRGSKNITVTWVLGSTEKHCKTCASLDGKKHRISWFLDRDYIPRKPGAAMECGGYNCDCQLVDKDGNEYTI